MGVKISCVNCGEFFQIIPGESEAFIEQRADKKFLKRFPFTKELRAIYKTRREYIASLLDIYCPYCRSVKFSFPNEPKYPKCTDAPNDNSKITDSAYLKMTEEEMRRTGGFHFGIIPGDT